MGLVGGALVTNAPSWGRRASLEKSLPGSCLVPQEWGQGQREGPSASHCPSHLLGGLVLPLQQGLAELQAGAEVLAPGFDLCLDALVILHEQLHRGDISGGKRGQEDGGGERVWRRRKCLATLACLMPSTDERGCSPPAWESEPSPFSASLAPAGTLTS